MWPGLKWNSYFCNTEIWSEQLWSYVSIKHFIWTTIHFKIWWNVQLVHNITWRFNSNGGRTRDLQVPLSLAAEARRKAVRERGESLGPAVGVTCFSRVSPRGQVVTAMRENTWRSNETLRGCWAKNSYEQNSYEHINLSRDFATFF